MQPSSRFEIISLSDAVSSLLPADSQLAMLAARDRDVFSNERIAVHRGDLTLDQLLLDDISNITGEDGIYTLLVQGHLHAGYLYNESTDGAVNLVVLGNLQVQNMAVGGQMIYVQGNLEVKELCWGDYNNGDLHVKGNAEGRVLLLTDEYHFRVEGETQFREKIGEDGDEVHFNFQLSHTFIADVMYEPPFDSESGEYHLYRTAMPGYWSQGKSVLSKLPALAFPFGDGAISEANIKRLAAAAVMPFNDHKFEFWLNDLFLRVTKPHPGKVEDYSVYLEKNGQYAVWIILKEQENRRIEIASRLMEGEDTQ